MAVSVKASIVQQHHPIHPIHAPRSSHLVCECVVQEDSLASRLLLHAIAEASGVSSPEVQPVGLKQGVDDGQERDVLQVGASQQHHAGKQAAQQLYTNQPLCCDPGFACIAWDRPLLHQ